MYRTRQFRVKKGHKMYDYCKTVTLASSHLYNRANFILRQYATAIRDFEEMKPLTENQISIYKFVQEMTTDTKYSPKGSWLTYGTIDYILKRSNDSAYYRMHSQSNQQTLKLLLRDYKSFFESIKNYKKNPDTYLGRPRLPRYKKRNTSSIAIYTNQICSIRDKKYLKFPGTKTRLNLGDIPLDSKLKEVRFIPEADYFMIEVVLEMEDVNETAFYSLEKTDDELIEELKCMEDMSAVRVLGIDPGVDNFCAVTNNFGSANLLIRGGNIKSVNHYYNKKLAELKAKAMVCNARHSTRRIERLHASRNRKVKDIMHKISRYIADYAYVNQVKLVILGHNKLQKQKIDIGDANNQNMVQIPFLQFANMLRYKLEEYGIRLILTEESYTSKADFLAQDKIPVYKKDDQLVVFSGKRIKRGLYQHKNGQISNADINGAANTIRKVFPNVKEWDIGVVDTPYAVTVA